MNIEIFVINITEEKERKREGGRSSSDIVIVREASLDLVAFVGLCAN